VNDLTRILSAIESGDAQAAEQLLPLVYDELRKLAAQKLAHEKPGQTLQATALVHEAYLRLLSGGREPPERSQGAPAPRSVFANRAHFFAAAAEAMRRILINRARDKGRQKRGGGRSRVDLAHIAIADDASDADLLAIDEALDELEKQNKPCADLVKLRFFAGLTMTEAAEAAGISPRTAHRYWTFARAWLYDALAKD
jgi:RNA polymerase sigma factor (TIGR02999 family)